MLPEQILAQLIRLNTVNPPGNEIKVVSFLKELFDRDGIAYEIVEPEKDRSNIVARIGTGTKKVLFLSHSDVVPAGEGWDFDPFAGAIEEGMVYGRGALDCKGLMAAQVYTFLRLAKESASLNGSLIFAATADEEKGGHFGVKYLLENCPQLIHADFAINEGGMEPVSLNGRLIYFIQVGEKGTAWSKLRVQGKSCHGSIPTLGENAVAKMAAAIHALAGYKAEITLIPEVERLLKELLRLQGADNRNNNIDVLLEGIEDRTLAETLRAMTRMTVSPNVVRGGSKTNIVPDSCSAEVDIRILPGQDEKYVIGELRRYLGEEIHISIDNYVAPSFSPSSSEYYRLVEETTKEVAGKEILCLPHISPGATDSRYLRGVGIPSYGIGHMAPDFDRSLRESIHGKNERIDIDSLYFKGNFLYALARKYLS